MVRALIVDDEEDIRDMLREELEDKGFSCDEAQNGLEAVELLKCNTYDYIFTDLNMPIMSGHDLIEEIRSNNLSSAHIIVASGYCGDCNEKYKLPKPWNDEDLVNILMEIIEEEKKCA